MTSLIRQVQIWNYKSIDRTVVDLGPFTILVGANGAGKSNFVDALEFVRDCVSVSVEHALKSRHGLGVVPRWQNLDSSHLGFRLVIDLPGGDPADYAFEVVLGRREATRIVRERCVIAPGTEHERGFEIAEGRFLREIPGIRPQLSADRLALVAASAAEELRPLYDFLSSMRFYSIEPQQLARWQDMDSGESLRQDASNAVAVLERLLEKEPERYQRIRRLLATVVPGIEGIGYEGPSKVLLKFRQEIGLDEPGEFFALEMSEGTLRVLGLLLAVYQLQRPSLLTIEEPEATVHPAAAELVTQVLLDASQNGQVLVTTHSPDILDFKELDDSHIRVVAARDGRTSIAPLAKASRQAIREHLYTPGELLRINELDQDFQEAQESARQLDLFGEVPASNAR